MIKYSFFSKGFTLVELLISISVMGILSAVILVAINPGEQMAKANDAGKKSAITQLAKALQSYNTIANLWPAAGQGGNPWMTQLKNAGELRTIFPSIGTKCNEGIEADFPNSYQENGYCYWRFTYNPTNTNEVSLWTKLDSNIEKGKCSGGLVPYYTWHSVRGSVCLACGKSTSPPSDWSLYPLNAVNSYNTCNPTQ